jgi:hypothetical protein
MLNYPGDKLRDREGKREREIERERILNLNTGLAMEY